MDLADGGASLLEETWPLGPISPNKPMLDNNLSIYRPRPRHYLTMERVSVTGNQAQTVWHASWVM